jgi:ribosome-associated protein
MDQIKNSTSSSLSSQNLVRFLTQQLLEKKAQDITVIDLTKKSHFADYFIIASGTSSRHLDSMSEDLVIALKQKNISSSLSGKGNNYEGMLCNWVLIDVGDVVVHLFKPETREFYDLEKLWNESK